MQGYAVASPTICDPPIVRLITAALVLFVGSGLILYIIAAIVMPYET